MAFIHLFYSYDKNTETVTYNTVTFYGKIIASLKCLYFIKSKKTPNTQETIVEIPMQDFTIMNVIDLQRNERETYDQIHYLNFNDDYTIDRSNNNYIIDDDDDDVDNGCGVGVGR